MDEALDLVFALDLDRHHKAPVSQCHDGFLQGLGVLRRADDAVQLLPHLQLRAADAPAQVGQGGSRRRRT